MRIAILTSLLFHETAEVQGEDRIIWGGAERYLHDLCTMLNEDGHVVDIYQSLKEAQPGGKHGDLIKMFAGCNVVCLSGTDDWHDGTNPRLNMMFNEFARGYDLSIFFATFLCWPYVPNNSISVSHGIYWDYPHHQYAENSLAGRKDFLRKHLYGFTAPALCVAVDSNVKKVISAMEPSAASRVMTIYNYVDTKLFVPKGEKNWDGIRVLFPRRLSTLRGCNDFFRLSEELPEHKYYAVGQAAKKEMEKRADMWSQSRNIQFKSYPMKEMEKTYQQVDISVVPTTACEGLSLALLESMSAALPVATTCVGGLGDAVIPGYNALIYDPQFGGLTEWVKELADNPAMRLKFGQRNREIARECFDIEIWKHNWREVISNFGGGS